MAALSSARFAAAPFEHVTDWVPALLDASAAALVAVDREGRTVFWSQGAEVLFGWSAAEVMGRPLPIVPLALMAEWQIQMARVFETSAPASPAETQRLASDGRLLTVVRSSAPIRDSAGNVVGLLDTLTDISQLKQIEEESRALAQVRERELIAMDLHDGLIQSLYALMLTLDARQRALPPEETVGREALTAALTDVGRVIDETRGYLFDLRAREFVPRDLRAGLTLLADGLRLNGGLTVELRIDPAVEHLVESALRGHLLLLAREAVSNILRHARATLVRIELGRTERHVTLLIADNGTGFSPPSARRERGGPHGLHNMSERARLMGGRLDLESGPNQGTTLSVEIPVEGRLARD